MRVIRKVLSGIIVAAGLCLAAWMLLPAAFQAGEEARGLSG